MARPVYPYELSDPDFVWLIETFLEARSDFVTLQESCLPVILFQRTMAQVDPEEVLLGLDSPFEKLLLPETEEESNKEE